MDFSEVIGHKQIINHLKNAIAGDRPGHAYIFHGEDGVGKSMVAREFARGILCQAGEGRPCGICKSCKQLESGNNPDFFNVTHEKAGIGVNDIRDQLIDPMSIKPYNNKYKVFIVDEAEKMNEQAQNALLKTLEEPPAYGVIILLSNNVNMFLDTILSRAVALAFQPVDIKDVTKYLLENREIPDYQARAAAALSGGMPGVALSLIDSDDFAERREMCLSIMRRIGNKREDFSLTKAKELSENKGDIEFFLKMFESYMRDILCYKSTKDASLLIFSDEQEMVKAQADKLSYEDIGRRIDAGRLLKLRLESNVFKEASIYSFLEEL